MDRRSLCLLIAVGLIGCSDIPTNHDTEEECGCVSEEVRMSPIGAPVQSVQTIAPCRVFKLLVEALADRPTTSCAMPMICPARPGFDVGGADVERALKQPDVQAALRSGIPRFGAGPEVDSTNPLYRLGIGSVDFEVGGPCRDAVDCTPVPAGVKTLLELMNKISAQEIKRSPCREDLSAPSK
jgi:hypothetical protein